MRILLSLLVLVSLAAGAFTVFRLLESAPGTKVEARLARTHFSFPAAFARDEATRNGGVADRLAFVATFPEFAPLERIGGHFTTAALTERDRKTVFIAVSAPDDALGPEERPARLYMRFLEGEVWSGPNGLVMRRFERDSPYESEQLYFAPPDGRAFFARCPKPRVREASSETCLSMFQWNSLDVELRFAPALLERWDALMEGDRDFLARISAGESAR